MHPRDSSHGSISPVKRKLNYYSRAHTENAVALSGRMKPSAVAAGSQFQLVCRQLAYLLVAFSASR